MLSAASNMAGLQGSERPYGGTFHAVAHRHVAAYAEVLDLPKGFGVLDPAGSCDLMDLLRGDHGLSGNAARYPRSATLVDIYSRCINNERPLPRAVARGIPVVRAASGGDRRAVQGFHDTQAPLGIVGLR